MTNRVKYIQFPGILFALEGRRHMARITLTTAEHGTLTMTRAEAARLIRRLRGHMAAYKKGISQ